MDFVAFERDLPGLYDSLRESLHPKNRKFKNLCREVDGMATENKLMALNFAASLLGPNEVYLEVGSWKGLSIIAAMMGNHNQNFYAIDDFSQFEGPKRDFQSNIQKYGFSEKLHFIEGDCFEIFRTKFLGSQKVGVYFYDGNHSYYSHYYAIKAIEPFLADNALLIIDDCSFPQVKAVNALFYRVHPNVRLLFDIRSDYNGEPKWWNGIQILSYRNDRGVKHQLRLALLQLAFEVGRIKFEFIPYLREYRRHSIMFSSFPNVLGNTIAYGLYRAVGKDRKALKAKERILKHWRYLTGQAYRPPRGRYTS
jgi:predicted O-methyltransferase YrrM